MHALALLRNKSKLLTFGIIFLKIICEFFSIIFPSEFFFAFSLITLKENGKNRSSPVSIYNDVN